MVSPLKENSSISVMSSAVIVTGVITATVMGAQIAEQGHFLVIRERIVHTLAGDAGGHQLLQQPVGRHPDLGGE